MYGRLVILAVSALVLFSLSQTANAQVQIDPASIYLNDNGNYVPYKLTQNSTDITINSMEGSYVFDKNACSISFYNGTDTNHKPVIGLDNYTVLASFSNTGIWNPVSLINNAQCNTAISENSGTVTITGTKFVSGAGLFSINYTKAPSQPLKLTFSARNDNPAWTNYHIGMSEFVQVQRYIGLGNKTYDLSQYNGTVLNRSWIQAHDAELIRLGTNSHYNIGLGWNHLNQITITYVNFKAYLKFDYDYNTPIISPGQTISVDPFIASDTSNTCNTDGATTCTITIGSNPHRMLVFFHHSYVTTTPISSYITAVKIGTTAFTKLVSRADNNTAGSIRNEVWYLLAPPTGAQTVTITYGVPPAAGSFIGLWSLYNVDQVSGINTATKQTVGGTNPATISITITPTKSQSWVASSTASCCAATGPSDTGIYTSVIDSPAATFLSSAQYKSSPTIGGPNTLTWSSSVSATRDYNAIAFEIMSFPNVPNAPTLTHANALNTTAIKLDWSSSVNATYYLVNRTTSLAGTYVQIKNTTLTSFTDTGLVPGAFYTYVVHAGNHTGISSASNVKSNYTQALPFVFRAYHRDNTTAVYGQGIQANTTSSNNRQTLVSGATTFYGLHNLNNFTAWNSLINFIVGKSYNYNTTTTHSLNMSTNDYDVDCPSTGTGIDVEVWTNGTNGHKITTFTTPTCFANNTIKWSTKFTANGNDANSYNTVVYVRAVNATFGTVAPLKFNNTKVTTTFGDPYILSNAVSVGTGLQTKLFNWSMNLTVSPAFTPVNFTVGHISVSGVNPVTVPIKFTTTVINSSATSVKVTFPSTFTMGYQLTFGNEGVTHTYTGLPVTSPSLGLSQSTITFKNPSNDFVTIKAYDIPTNTTASTILAQPNTNVPFVTQFKNFKNGLFGTSAMIGGINIIDLIVLIVAMIGLNRANEIVGAFMMVIIVGVAGFFGIITWPTALVSAIALATLVTVVTMKKYQNS